MSATSRWVYTNVSTVWPNLGRDPRTREPLWGEPFVIACTFKNMGATQTDNNGEEFVPQDTIWHENPAPISAGDRVLIGRDVSYEAPPVDAKPIRKVGGWDMSFFGENPDFVFFT